MMDTIHIEEHGLDARIQETAANAGHVVEVTLIRAGTSSNGNHYPDGLLRQSAPLFEGVRAFADHAGPVDRRERSVRDLVGHYRNARYEQSPSGGRIRADFRLLSGQDWLWGIIQEAETHEGICGLSIDALGEVSASEVDGKKVRLVESFKKINSVDIVTRPAAGGELERIVASEAEPAPVPEDSGTLTAEERKEYATVVRHHPDGSTEYKFPIPPTGRPGAASHASAALARLDQSDLTDKERALVRAKAEAILGTQAKEAHMESDSREATQAPVPANGTKPSDPPIRPSLLREGTEIETSPSSVDLPVELKKLQAERDAAALELRQIREALAPSPVQPVDPNATAVQLLEQIKHERDVEKAGRLLASRLAESRLPEPIQNRLRRRYEGTVFGETQLVEDVNEERDVLGKLSATGQVVGHGYEKPLLTGMSEYEQLQAAFDKMFDVVESDNAQSVPSLGGIREAFRIATGVDITATGGVDRPLQEAYASGLRNYVRSRMESGRLTEAEYLLREADVTTGSFSYLLGTSMNKRLLKDYQAWPSEWQKFCNTVAVKDFKQQDRIRLGAFGSLSQVAEDAAYTTLTLADTHATYTPAKYGNLVQVSRETIINDDLYAIKQIPQKLAVAAAFTLAEFIYEFLDPNGGNIYDGTTLFRTTHGNSAVANASLGAANSGTAFSAAGMQAGVIKMRKQTNAAGKPIGLKPRFLLVPPDLEFTAMTVLKSAGLPGGTNNDINPMMGYAEPIVAPQLNSFAGLGATTTFAALVADPRVIDTIEIGFVGGQINPVLFIQDQPLYGLNFTQDVISYKVRHEYGGAVVDYRGFYLINN